MARIIEIKDTPARIKLRHGCIVVEDGDNELLSLPREEVGILILSHPAVSCTSAAISGIADGGGVLVTCDSKFLPNGMLLPLQGHHIQTQRFITQIEVSQPLKKRIWQSIVQRKILNQGTVLLSLFGDDFAFPSLAILVKSGDVTNIEARAAKKYWGILFGSNSFRRSNVDAIQNSFLNYGYAVLRATVARAICAAGLHPSIGIHHRNKYNPFCLADDLMEPFRPCVDWIVARLLVCNPSADIACTKVRGEIISAVSGPWKVRGENRTIFDSAGRLASSVVTAFQEKNPLIELPTLEV